MGYTKTGSSCRKSLVGLLNKGKGFMKRYSIVFLLFLVFGQCAAHSGENAVSAKIKDGVQTAYPELKIDSVEKSPVHGLYQLTAGPLVLYASNDGRYLINGDVFDLALKDKDNRNVTEEIRRKNRLELLKPIHPDSMVIYAPKEIKGVVTIFTDPDCGYCRKLHSEVSKLVDLGIEVRYMAFPRQGIGSPTYDKMVSIWCSKDRADAMSKAMQGEEIETQVCSNNVGEQFVLGEKLGLNGTPALLFPDGALVGGYLPATKLAEEAIKHSLKK